jgi:hypothetical protein
MPQYETLLSSDTALVDNEDAKLADGGPQFEPPFSWLEYFSFFTIGLSMMWTW